MTKRMERLEMDVASDGTVVLTQPDDARDASDTIPIHISPDQVPLVARWMLEAVGLGHDQPAEGRKLEEVRMQAHLFRRLEQAALEENPPMCENIDPLRAVRIALDWAAGDSDFSPDEWHHPEKED